MRHVSEDLIDDGNQSILNHHMSPVSGVFMQRLLWRRHKQEQTGVTH
jgi:hypothetical protein